MKNQLIIYKSFSIGNERYSTSPITYKNYRIYSSRRANIYKKFHQIVRKCIENKEYSSIAAHKASLTKKLNSLNRTVIHHPNLM